jgi:hypothetical protein
MDNFAILRKNVLLRKQSNEIQSATAEAAKVVKRRARWQALSELTVNCGRRKT